MSRAGRPSRPMKAEPEERDDEGQEDFFEALPDDSLTNLEVALRQAIVDFLHARKPKAFPLTQWIDRRIGGEMETVLNAEGGHDVKLRPPPPPSRAPKEDTTEGEAPAQVKEEIDTSPRSHKDDQGDSELRPKGSAEPEGGSRRNVPAGGRPPVRRGGPLPDAGREQRLEQEIRPGDWECPACGKNNFAFRVQCFSCGASKPASAKPDALAPMKRQEFFDSLPADEFSPEEADLRNALLNFLSHWSQERPPCLSEAGSDEDVKKARAAFLPRGSPVSLVEWIHHRIGAELETMEDPRDRQVVFGHTGQLEAQLRKRQTRTEHGPEGGDRERGGGKRSSGPLGPSNGASRASKEEAARRSKDEWFAQLPVDGFTPQEHDMRDALLSFLDCWGQERDPSLAEVMQDPHVAERRLNLFPKSVPVALTDWIERRVGGEIAVEDSIDEGILVKRRQPQGTRERGGRKRKKEEDVRPGDWTCPGCGVNNFGSRVECFKCGHPKPVDRDQGSRFSAFEVGKGGAGLPGDWECPRCSVNNFARRDECFKCGEPRPGRSTKRR